MGCRMGVNEFVQDGSGLSHYIRESNHQIHCNNTADISTNVRLNEQTGTFLPNDELGSFLINQSYWWSNIIALSNDVFTNPEEINNFFNGTVNGISIMKHSDDYIENQLISIGQQKDIEITQDVYPDLRFWSRNRY